jgi:hypothetical protein
LIWCYTPAGKKAPIEEAAHPDGNVMVLKPHGWSQPLAIVLTGPALALAQGTSTPLHLNHFATCPERERFKPTA